MELLYDYDVAWGTCRLFSQTSSGGSKKTACFAEIKTSFWFCYRVVFPTCTVIRILFRSYIKVHLLLCFDVWPKRPSTTTSQTIMTRFSPVVIYITNWLTLPDHWSQDHFNQFPHPVYIRAAYKRNHSFPSILWSVTVSTLSNRVRVLNVRPSAILFVLLTAITKSASSAHRRASHPASPLASDDRLPPPDADC